MKRFWDKVNKTDNCWNWIASGRGQGYGAFKFQGKTVDAHRMSWFLHYGHFPDLLVCHTCDNKLCVRPEHLFLGTHKDNMQDCSKKNRISRTSSGAKFGDKNPNTILSDNLVLEIFNLYNTKEYSYQMLAITYNVSKNAIYKAIRKRAPRLLNII